MWTALDTSTESSTSRPKGGSERSSASHSKAKLLVRRHAAGVFGSGPATEAAPTVDLKLLHAKIGELTLEKDFLSGALSKAGLLSAKR